MRALSECRPDMGDHVTGVARLAEQWRSNSGCPRPRSGVRLAAAFPDVGKMAIPAAILEKPGPLSEHERQFLDRHTIIGARILHAAPDLSQLSDLVRSSHERIDGKGYPDGLAGDEIPLASRIIFVCDAFDAMTSDRPYAKAMTPAQGTRRATTQRRHPIRLGSGRGARSRARRGVPGNAGNRGVALAATRGGHGRGFSPVAQAALCPHAPEHRDFSDHAASAPRRRELCRLGICGDGACARHRQGRRPHSETSGRDQVVAAAEPHGEGADESIARACRVLGVDLRRRHVNDRFAVPSDMTPVASRRHDDGHVRMQLDQPCGEISYGARPTGEDDRLVLIGHEHIGQVEQLGRTFLRGSGIEDRDRAGRASEPETRERARRRRLELAHHDRSALERGARGFHARFVQLGAQALQADDRGNPARRQ